MLRTFVGLAAAALLAVLPAAACWQYSVKENANGPQKDVPEPFRKLLNERSVQMVDAQGKALCEIWFRKEVPAKASPGQIKNGLTYREIPETTLLGVIQISDGLTDYRKQRINPGVYTLRLGYQPQDGDHMGTAPHGEFCLAVPIGNEKGVEPMEAKDLHSLSLRASKTSHPAVFLLFPGTDAGEQPKLVDKGEGHWALLQKLNVTADGTK